MKIDHIALNVVDLEGAKKFFETYFGGTANNLYHNPRTGLRTYFISFAGGCRLELMHRSDNVMGTPDTRAGGYMHVAFNVGSREAVDSLTLRLARAGYEVLDGPRTTGDGYYESSVCGFEGNIIEITE